MASFSIDEVRDSFSADMTAFLAEIDGAAGALESSLNALPTFPKDAHQRPLFEAIAARAHAVAGTGGLVGAWSLNQSGKLLETLTRHGQVALMRARAQLARAAEIAQLCGTGAKAMQAMLELELGHRREDADAAARAWEDRLAPITPVAEVRTEELQMLGEAGAERGPEPADAASLFHEPQGSACMPQPSGAREFSFEDDAPTPVNAFGELEAIFRQELGDSLGALQGHLRALEARAEDLASAEQLERLYHTLKGASATVGLTQVSALAASLQRRVEQAIETGAKVSPELRDDLVRDTNRLLELSGLSPLSCAPGEPAPSAGCGASDAGPAPELFAREALAALDQAAHMTAKLQASGNGEAPRIQAALAQLFHRVKGSALVAGEAAAAGAAAALQERCESGAALEPASLAAGLAQLGAAIAPRGAGPPQASAAPRPQREEVEVEQDPELWEAFQQECSELLEGIEREALALEQADKPHDLLQSLMRQHHTLKGAVNSVALAPTGRLLHRIEDFLEALLEAKALPPLKGVADLLLEAQAEVRRHLSTARQGFVESALGPMNTRIRRVFSGPSLEGSTAPGEGPPAPSAQAASAPSSPRTRGPLEERPPADRFGSSPRTRGPLEERPPADRFGSSPPEPSSTEQGFIRVATEQLDGLMNLAGELVVSRSRLASRVSSLRSMQQGLSRSQRRLLEHVEEFVGKHEFEDLDGRSSPRKGPLEERPSADRFGSTRAAQGAPPGVNGFGDLELDRYGDVHILSRSLAEVSDDLGEVFGQLFHEMGEIADDAETFGGIVTGIQREVTRARMVPLENVFTRLRLPVRDAASREEKEVRIATFGEAVNLDKKIADAIFQPMLHLVRNAVVHGIESSAGREASGKPRFGTLELGARQESGQIVLEVRDDGRGLDLAALHARGVAMGLVEPGTAPTDPPVKDLVFAPGLTTTARPGMVSGRGFGGDVVRKSIERLNGSIRVETAAGVGTVFTITLPLTLAITRALLVRHGGRLYAIPLFFAEHLFDLEEARVVESLGARRLKLGEAFVPVRSLGEVFGAESSAPASGPVLILRVGEQRLAVQVDGVVAQEEIVVKGLGELLSGHPVLAGVTIRGNGELVLILDVPGVLERVFGAPRKAAPTSAPVESPPLLRSTRSEETQGGESRVAAGAIAPNRAPPPDLAGRPGSDPVPQDFEDLGAAGAPEPPHQGTAGGAALGRSIRLEPPEEAPALPGGASTPRPEGPLRVLFVDDSVSVRKVAERALLGLGVQVAVAVDGLDAMEKLRAQRFDLVFTDLEMPRMHGYELIRELRFLPSYRSLPVVVVSSRSGQKHQDQARALGATDYLTKPFNAETLDAALRRWASRPGAPDRGEEPR